MFALLSEAYAMDVMNGSLLLSYMLWGTWLTAIAVHYFAVFGYQWVNDVDADYGSRWLLFNRFDEFFDSDVINYMVGGIGLGSIVVPLLAGLALGAITTVPWLFAIIIAVLASMKLTRGVVRLKKKLNTHINDNEAHKEK